MGRSADSSLPELDGLRGLLALWVFGGHLLAMTGLQDDSRLVLLANGQIPVTVFMMLSGFVIAHSLARTPRRYHDYMLHRAARVYPAYFASLALAGLAILAIAPSARAYPFMSGDALALWTARRASEVQNLGLHLGAHLLLLHGAAPEAWVHDAPQALNGPAWSLSLEWQFYLVAPLAFLALRRPSRRPAALAALLAVCAAGAWGGFRRAYPLVPSFLPMQLGVFVVGMATALGIEPLVRRPRLALGLAALVIVGAERLLGPMAAIPLALWLATVGLIHLPERGPLRRALSSPALVAFGRRSYGFYLYHAPMLMLVAAALAALAPTIGRPLYVVALLAALPLTDALARLSWGRLEQPVLAAVRRRAAQGDGAEAASRRGSNALPATQAA